jgi:hypothetical protein
MGVDVFLTQHLERSHPQPEHAIDDNCDSPGTGEGDGNAHPVGVRLRSLGALRAIGNREPDLIGRRDLDQHMPPDRRKLGVGGVDPAQEVALTQVKVLVGCVDADGVGAGQQASKLHTLGSGHGDR